MKISIRFASYQVDAELFDTPTGRAVYAALPITENVERWGDEIYFEFPEKIPLEPGSRAVVEVGELGYWPRLPAFCVFFGPTPASTGNQPVAASAVNVFGRLLDPDLQELRKIQDVSKVTVTRMD